MTDFDRFEKIFGISSTPKVTSTIKKKRKSLPNSDRSRINKSRKIEFGDDNIFQLSFNKKTKTTPTLNQSLQLPSGFSPLIEGLRYQSPVEESPDKREILPYLTCDVFDDDPEPEETEIPEDKW